MDAAFERVSNIAKQKKKKYRVTKKIVVVVSSQWLVVSG